MAGAPLPTWRRSTGGERRRAKDDAELWRRDRVVVDTHGRCHYGGDRAGDDQGVGVSRWRHDRDAEAPEVEANGAEDMEVRLTTGAPAGAQVWDAQGAAVEGANRLAGGQTLPERGVDGVAEATSRAHSPKEGGS